MTQIAKRHHYLPVYYLSNFTGSGTNTGKLFVLNINTGNDFTTTPKNIGCKTGLYTANLPGIAPDFFEKNIDQGKFIEVYQRIVCDQKLPKKIEEKHLAVFVALTLSRNPTIKEILWDTFLEKEGFKYKVPCKKDLYPLFIAHTMPIFFKSFVKGYWTLLIPKEKQDYFLCCDYPISVKFKNSGAQIYLREVRMPLSKNLGLIWRKVIPIKKHRPRRFLSSEAVAAFNFKILINHKFQIYLTPNFSQQSLDRLTEKMLHIEKNL